MERVNNRTGRCYFVEAKLGKFPERSVGSLAYRLGSHPTGKLLASNCDEFRLRLAYGASTWMITLRPAVPVHQGRLLITFALLNQ